MKQRNLFLLCIIPLLGWWLYGVFDLDEGFYASVATEMNARGEWITPYFNGNLWYEKPILLYWLAKPCLMLFDSPFGARIPSILATIATYGLVLWFARHHLDKLALRPIRSGFVALFALATSLLFVAVGRMIMTDTLLTFCLTAALFGFWHGLTVNPKAWLWAGAALGASVLAKGPVGIILFVPIAWYGMRITRGQSREGNTKWAIAGAAIMVAIITSWYLPAYLKDGDVFVQKFLIEQNLNRFTGGDSAHTVGGITRFIFFIPILMLGMAPWSWFIKRSWPRRNSDLSLKFLGACAFIPFFFFTISSAKLPHYILPCFPPLALLVGHHLAGVWPSWPKWTWGWLAGLALLANGGMLFWYKASGHAEVHALAQTLRGKPEPVAVYQMPRREKALGTGKPKIQETSHPSLEFVLGKSYIEAETLDDLTKSPGTQYVLTRSNRITEADRLELKGKGFTLTPVDPIPSDNYRLYKLEKDIP